VWQGFDAAVEAARQEHGDFRAKSEDAYRHAAATISTEPPPFFADLVERITDLVA
jgi:hypothetical protein